MGRVGGRRPVAGENLLHETPRLPVGDVVTLELGQDRLLEEAGCLGEAPRLRRSTQLLPGFHRQVQRLGPKLAERLSLEGQEVEG